MPIKIYAQLFIDNLAIDIFSFKVPKNHCNSQNIVF